MPNEYINHVVINGVTKLDLRGDTITASSLAQGITAHDRSGAPIVGTNTGSGGSVTQDQDGYIVLPSTGGGGGSTTLKMGVIRPDAELVQSWTYDKWIVADEGVTLPAYTTSAQTLKASASLDTTATLDASTYDYFLIAKTLAMPTYNIDTKANGRIVWTATTSMYELLFLPSQTLGGEGAKDYQLYNFVTQYSTVNHLCEWMNDTRVNTYNQSLGIYQTLVSPSLTYSNAVGTLTVKSPALMLGGNAAKFPQTFFDALTDIRYQWRFELYRSERGEMNIDGWGHRQLLLNANACANSASGNLT